MKELVPARGAVGQAVGLASTHRSAEEAASALVNGTIAAFCQGLRLASDLLARW